LDRERNEEIASSKNNNIEYSAKESVYSIRRKEKEVVL
jgi:hypothetical protein